VKHRELMNKKRRRIPHGVLGIIFYITGCEVMGRDLSTVFGSF
jgi:hypothetical protein